LKKPGRKSPKPWKVPFVFGVTANP